MHQSERFVDATARLRLIREARRRPLDEQLLERRIGLDNREVVAPRAGPKRCVSSLRVTPRYHAFVERKLGHLARGPD